MAATVQDIRSRYEFKTQVLDNPAPVSVLFYGDDDNSMKMRRQMAELARHYGDQIDFIEVNAIAADLLAADYHIKPEHLPMVSFFHSGKIIKSWHNEHNVEVYRRQYDEVLAQMWRQ